MSRRRLDRLEASLGPQEAVLRWLSEAHAFGSLPAYVAWLVEQPDTAHPLVDLPGRVESAVRRALRDRPAKARDDGIRRATFDTCFRYRLVLELNDAVEQVARHERMRMAALMWWLRAMTRDDGAGRARWCEVARLHRSELQVLEAARSEAEARYLDGHASLFPDLEADWRSLIDHAERLVPGILVGTDAGSVAPSPPDPVHVEAHLAGLIARARIGALDLIGDVEGARFLERQELLTQAGAGS